MAWSAKKRRVFERIMGEESTGPSWKDAEAFKEIGREPISRLKDPLRFRLPARRFIETPFNQA